MEKNLIRKFSIYSILIIAILGIVLNLVISSRIENMVIERSEITKLQMTIAIIIFLGLFTLYFSLIWIVKDASETIMEQNLALIKSHEELKEMDKMKNEFINSMSHELRTPLNAVIGFSDLMKQKNAGELNERQEHYIDNILKSGKHLLAIVNDILDMIVIEAGKTELVLSTFSVPFAIDENIECVTSNTEKNNVIINKEIDPQLESIEADEQKFSQILVNILDNALKFSKKDGGVVNIIARKKGDNAQFSISDNGIGIKEENFKKLFMVFQQLDTGISRKYGGTGLGLSISKKLVELHGGKIWVESKYGEGTTFTFELPLAQKKEVKTND